MSLKAYQREIYIFYLFILICYTAHNIAASPHVGLIQVTLDNVLETITVNGNALSLSGLVGLNDWTQVKTINVPSLKSGDVIAITASNIGTYSLGNPAGILATITYYGGCKGVQKKFNTGNRWKCDEVQASLQGENGQTNTIWYQNRGGSIPDISLSAQWIWFSNLSRPRTICSARLP